MAIKELHTRIVTTAAKAKAKPKVKVKPLPKGLTAKPKAKAKVKVKAAKKPAAPKTKAQLVEELVNKIKGWKADQKEIKKNNPKFDKNSGRYLNLTDDIKLAERELKQIQRHMGSAYAYAMTNLATLVTADLGGQSGEESIIRGKAAQNVLTFLKTAHRVGLKIDADRTTGKYRLVNLAQIKSLPRVMLQLLNTLKSCGWVSAGANYFPTTDGAYFFEADVGHKYMRSTAVFLPTGEVDIGGLTNW